MSTNNVLSFYDKSDEPQGSTIRRARFQDLDVLSGLFHDYRLFYELDSQFDECRSFIGDRIRQGDSVLYLALDEAQTSVGFMQLYPLFSEATLKRIWLLNDLFVVPEARKQGVASALLTEAKNFVQEQGGTELTLSTAKDNFTAQKLYESQGYIRDDQFLTYRMVLE